MKTQGSKHEARDPYMVTGIEGDKIIARKILHSTQSSGAGPALSSEIHFLANKVTNQENTCSSEDSSTNIHHPPEKNVQR